MVMSSVYTGTRLNFEPKYAPASPKPGVEFVHGAGSTALYCIDPLGKQAQLTRMLVGAGFSGGSSDLGGTQTWGNSTGTTALDASVTSLMARPNVKTGKVALVSASAGGLLSLNYARANPGKVSCIVSVIPVINPEDIRANNRDGYATFINAAYGGTYVEATQGATRNPYTYRAAPEMANIPMLLIYGATDTLCLPTFTQQFAAAAPTKRTLVSLPTGHDFATYDAVDHSQILDFINTYNV